MNPTASLRISIPPNQLALTAALDNPRVLSSYIPEPSGAELSPEPGQRRAPTPSPAPPASLLRPRLLLGGAAATAPAFLAAHGVTHVLNCLGPSHEAPGGHATLSLALADCETQRIDFAPALAFLRNALQDPGAVVLLHCWAGVSRSAAVAAAHLMATEGLRMEEALAQVRAARPRAAPNAAFLAQLVELEAALWGPA